MRRLLLLRHAKSDWSAPGMSDHDRPLAPRGRKAAPRMGRYMAEHALLPDHVIVSTAKRTRETWRLVAQELPGEPTVTFDSSIYEAAPSSILAAIAAAPASARTLLVVGHNPGFEDTAGLLVGSGDKKARQAMAEKFATGALAVIDFDVSAWDAIRPGHGRLERFATPRAIGEAND